MLNKIKIALSCFAIGFIFGAIALTIYNDQQKPIVTVETIEKPIYVWNENPVSADCNKLRLWAESKIVLSYIVGTSDDKLTPLYVTAYDANKTTRETWGIKTSQPKIKHWGASVMFSPRKNMYGIGTYNVDMFFLAAGACVPIKSMMTFEKYDIFGGGGAWF